MTSPRILLVVALTPAGCVVDDVDEQPPFIAQPGPSVHGATRPGDRFHGTICVIQDLRDRTTCRTTADLSDLTVTLGSSAAVTARDGSFTIVVPPAVVGTSTGMFVVTGPNVVPSAFPVRFPLTGTGSIPVVDADIFARMLSSNGVLLGPGTGSILATVRGTHGQLVADVTVRSSPVSSFGPFFDTSSPVTWGLGGTSTRGVAWIPGLTAGVVDLSFEHIAGGLETTVAGVQVRNGGVTILDTTLPTVP